MLIVLIPDIKDARHYRTGMVGAYGYIQT